MKNLTIFTGALIMSMTLSEDKNSGATEEPAPASPAVATFAGGCFWCMEPPFEKLPGVIRVESGYTGGTKDNPTYKEVSSGTTGHVEAVRVHYDPAKVRYDQLLDVFWRNINPTDPGGQFADRGSQYATGIYYHTPEQKKQAETSRARLEKSGRFEEAVVTPIIPARKFFPAEEYHQDYYKKSPGHYQRYRRGSGRSSFLERMWDDYEKEKTAAPPDTSSDRKATYTRSSKSKLKKSLTPLQYNVAVDCGTEPPFNNEYWDNKREGIYVDIISGEPLFSSKDKFASGTGWPSFTRPIENDAIEKRIDNSHSMQRIEVRGRSGNTHLGHLFPDGPAPTGLRYCINSASLKFIPRERLEEEGYGEYLELFK